MPAIAFLGAIYCAANFGGSITAILINTPGDPSASATAFDGYPLARRGEAGRALGMSAVASAIGGIFSVVVLIVAAPLLARLAYQFGPPEYFALAVFGLSMVAAVGGDSPAKNLIAGACGVLLATIGLDLTTGVERFTFGMPALSDGLGFIPVLIGLFAIAELLERTSQRGVVQECIKLKAMRPADAGRTSASARKAISLSSVLGTFIGILPALGRHHRGAHLLQRDQALVEVQGGVRQGRDRGRGRARGREQRRRRRRDGADARARHPRQHHHRDHPRRADHPGRAPRPAPLQRAADAALRGLRLDAASANLLYLVLGFAFAKVFARITLIPDAFLWPAVLILSVVGAALERAAGGVELA